MGSSASKPEVVLEAVKKTGRGSRVSLEYIEEDVKVHDCVAFFLFSFPNSLPLSLPFISSDFA